MASMRFIDISRWQGDIATAKVAKNGGLGAVIVKATEGTGYVSSHCDREIQEAISAGLRFGFYHFARHASPEAECDFFIKHTKGYQGKGIPVLDWEDGQSIDWVNRWVKRYHDRTGVWPWVYGNAWRFNQGTVNTNCGRWIAGYPKNGITDIAYGEKNVFPYKVNNGLVCAWQFSSSVRISGYSGNLDGNIFYGDAAAWDAYAGGKPSSAGVPSSGLGDLSWTGPRMISEWQRQMGTEVDGYLSGQTAYNKRRVLECVESACVHVGKGGSALVIAVQKLVGADPDGHFGSDTVTAVQMWLKSKGLYRDRIDGHYGPNTSRGVGLALEAKLFQK